jgi:uncharacterized protein YndB with AHSA1/START domain
MSATLAVPHSVASPAPSSPFLRQSRVIRAPRARVYQAWVQPEIMKQWFSSDKSCPPEVALDVREGGLYRIAVTGGGCSADAAKGSAGLNVADGVYTEVVPNEKLQFTWRATWNPLDDSLVTVTFRDAEGGTQVTILHERITGDGGYEQGWTRCLTSIDELLAS